MPIDLTNTYAKKMMKIALATVESKKKGICLETEGAYDNFISISKDYMTHRRNIQ